MRALVFLLLLLPLAAAAQPAEGAAREDAVRYAIEAPEAITLGEPLVLHVSAVLTAPGGYPAISLRGFQREEAVTVRRDSASGEIVDLHPVTIFCGIGVPRIVGGDAYPAGTAAHRTLVVDDARLMAPGRYVVAVPLHSWDGTPEVTLRHTVAVVAPEAPAERRAAEVIAQAIRAITDRRYWDGPAVRDLDVMLGALATAGDAPGADALRVRAALEASGQSVQWAYSDRPEADSVAARHLSVADSLVALYLSRHPAGRLAPEAARARQQAHAMEGERPPSVSGLCEGRVFRVYPGDRPLALRLVGIGTGAAVTIGRDMETGASGVVDVVFPSAPEAVHLVREGKVVAVALPGLSSCERPWGEAPQRIQAE